MINRFFDSRGRRWDFAGAVVVLLVSLVAILSPPAAAEPLVGKAIYNEETKSWFMLVPAPNDGSSYWDINWEHARSYAQAQVHQGIHGRLAIVPSKSVNDFLRDTFKPNKPTWIGLRYWCSFRKLQWVDNNELKRSEYNNWAKLWNVSSLQATAGDQSSCQSTFLPIYYLPIDQGFRWQAQGFAKSYTLMFVEFPTAEP